MTGLLTARGRALAGLLLALGLSACASPRYIGTLGRGDIYANRGYGVVANLSQGGLTDRWTVVDPSDLEQIAPADRPARVRGQIDLNGNGLLELPETIVFYEPTLRLLSKTSSTARIDLDVQILGENNFAIPLDALVALDLKAAATSSAARDAAFAAIERRTVGEAQARVVELDARTDRGPRRLRLAIVDVPDFETETKTVRRQIVRVRLTAPALDDAMRADLGHLLDGLLVARRGKP